MALRQPPRYRVKKGKTSEDSDDFESFEYPHDAIDYLHKIHACSEGEIYDNTFKEIVIRYNLTTGKVITEEIKKGDVQMTYAPSLHDLAKKPVEDAVCLMIKRMLLLELAKLDVHVEKIVEKYFNIEKKENQRTHKRLDEAFKQIRDKVSPPLFRISPDMRTPIHKAIHKILTPSKMQMINSKQQIDNLIKEIRGEMGKSRLSSSAKTRTQAPTRKHRK